MDPLAGLLDGPRARGAFVMRALLDPPWSIDVRDEAPLSVVALLRGEAWVVPRDGERRHLAAGDVAVTRGPDPMLFADDPATPPQIVCQPGQRTTTPDGGDLCQALDLGVRSWGTNPDGSTALLIGTYQLRGDISEHLLAALPPLVVVRGGELDSPLVPLLAREIVRDDPGQELVLDRLVDLLVIATLRAWFGRPDTDAPAWYRASADPVVGRALRMLQNNPAHPWTVASLAAEVGASRAALARRFTELVGEPPMAYLTSWRLTLAADLLREPAATVTSVARQVGYGTPFALSNAFKRVRGMSPKEHRARALAATG